MDGKLASLYVILGAQTEGFKTAISDLNRTIGTAQKEWTAQFKNIAGVMRTVGAEMTAVGVAGLKMTSDANKWNASLGQIGITLGVSTGAMRDMVQSVTNVDFGINEVISTFDELSKAGIKNVDDLKKSASAFNALGDATGQTADVVASDLLPAYKALGEKIPDASTDLDKFTWLVKNTTVDLGDFSTVVTRLAPEMTNAGLSINDVVIALAVLNERGITGRKATQQLGDAIKTASEQGITLSKALGLTTDEVNKYQSVLSGATGLTDKYSAAANTQYGVIDQLKQKFQEISLILGSFLKPLEGVFAAFTTLGPLFLFFSTSIGITTTRWIAHTVALIADKVAALAAAAANAILNSSLGPLGWALIGLGVALGIATPLIANMTNKTKELTNEVGKLSGVSQRHVQLLKALGDTTWDAAMAQSNEVDVVEKGTKAFEDAQKTIDDFSKSITDLATAYQYNMSQAGRLGVTMDTMKTYLISIGLEASLSADNFNRYGNDVNAWAAGLGIDLRSVATASKITFDSMYSDAEKATNTAISDATKVANAEKTALDQRAQYYKDFTYEKLDLIDSQMMAELAAANPDVATAVQGFNDQITALNDKAAKRQADDTARHRADLVVQLEKGRYTLTQDEKAALQEQIDAIDDEAKKEQIISDRNNAIKSVNMQSYFDTQKEKLDDLLTNQTNNYNADLTAFKKLNTDKLADLATYVTAYNAIMAGLGGTPINIPSTPNTNYTPYNPLSLPSYGIGGTVSGAIGKPQMAIVHGGETITPISQQSKKGDTINIWLGNKLIKSVVLDGISKDIRLQGGYA